MPNEELLNDYISNNESNLSDDEAPISQDEEIFDESPESSPDDESFSFEEESAYVAIKGSFYTPKADNAGVFCFIYKGENGKMIFREVWAIRSNKEPIADISERWENFIRDMNKIGTYDKDSTDKLSPLIEKSLSSNIKEYLYKNIVETEFAATEIRKSIEKALRYLVEIKIDAEIFGEERAKSGGILRDKDPASGKPKDNNDSDIMNLINFQGIPIICQPIIDPANGSPVSNIKVGDIVHVTIQESNDIAKRVTDYVRAGGGDFAFPVSLVQSMDSGKCVVLLKISDEISGVLNISPKIMLKVDSMDDESIFSKLSFNPMSVIMTGGVILFIVLLLYLIARLI